MSKCFYCTKSEYIIGQLGKPVLDCKERKYQRQPCEVFADGGCVLFERNNWRNAFIEGSLKDRAFARRMELLHQNADKGQF